MAFVYKPITHKWDILPDIEENFLRIQGELGGAGLAKFTGWPVDAQGNYVYPNTSGSGGKPYVLPAASSTAAGGVIIGAGVIGDATGKISVTPASIGALTKTTADTLYAPITVTQGITQADADLRYSPAGALTKAQADGFYETIADAQLRMAEAVAISVSASAKDAQNRADLALEDAKAYADGMVNNGTGTNQQTVIGLSEDVADAKYAPIGALTQKDADLLYAPVRLKTEAVVITGDQEIDGKKTFKTLPTVKIGSNPETNLATEEFVTSHAVSGGTPYTLPPADDHTLGGVKVGTGIVVDPDGKISVDTSSITATVTPATKTTLGGIIVGDNLTIDATGKLSATVSNSGGTISTTDYYPNDGIIDGTYAPTFSINNDRGSDNWFRIGHFVNIRNGSGCEIEVIGAPGIDGGWNETPPTVHNSGMQNTKSVIGMHKNRRQLEASYYHLGSKPALLEAKIERTLTASSLPTPLSGVIGTTILNTLYVKLPSYTTQIGFYVKLIDGARVKNSAKFFADGSLVTQADIDAITTLSDISQRMSIGTSQAGVSANGVDNNLYLTAGTGGEVVVNNRVLSGLADPVDPTDSANKRYVDGLMAQVGSGGVVSSGGSARVFKSWAAMKVTKPASNGEMAWLQSYQSGNKAHGCGWFKGVTNVGSGSYADDGGIICRGTDFAWERQYSDDNTLTIYDFGAWGDGDNATKTESWKSDTELNVGVKVHDDGPAMLAMCKYMTDKNRTYAYRGVNVRIPAGSFAVDSVDFGSVGSMRIQGPYVEYGRQPAAYIIAINSNQDKPLLSWTATSNSISGIQFDGRAGILKNTAGPKNGFQDQAWIRAQTDNWPVANENGGKAKKRAYVKDLIDPNKGKRVLWGKQPIIDIGHNGAGYLNVKCVTWKNIGGAGITWTDAIDTKFDQVYSSTTFAPVINSTWSCYGGGSWDHATAVEITNANFQTGFLKPILMIPRCAQSMIHNVWLEHSEYPGNISNGHWMIDSYNQEDCLNCMDARSSRLLVRHLDSIDNAFYNNPRNSFTTDKYGNTLNSVFLMGSLSGKNPTSKRNPNDPVVYADGTPVPANKIDLQTLGSADQCKAYNDAVAAGKTGADLDKYLVTNNRNWDLSYSFLSAYEDGVHQYESQYQISTGSMKYGWMAGHQLPPNPDSSNANDYYVNLLSTDSQYDGGTGLIEIDIFTKSDASNGRLTDDPTGSGAGGITKIKIYKTGDASTTTYYHEGQSGVLGVYSNKWGGPQIWVKLDKNCSRAVAFARSSGRPHHDGGTSFLLNWQLTAATSLPSSHTPSDKVCVGRVDFNNGAGNAGIGLVGKRVSIASTSNTTAPTGTPKGTIEILLDGNVVKIPYYV